MIDFLYELTVKITFESPHIAEMLLADQTAQSRKEKKYDYVPLQIVLYLHMYENNEDDEKNTLALRQVLLLMLKQSTMNPKIRDYVLMESELPILLVAKLAHIYSYLPEKLNLIRNPNVSEMYPTADQEQNYHHLNLMQQVTQGFGKEMVEAHCEFVKFCCYFNLICETLQVEPKLSKQLQVCLFNYFLIDIMQARLLDENIVKRRTALQYIEQMLDIFTCSDLVNVIFIFLTGLPVKTKEEEFFESDDLDSSVYNSRLSMSIEGTGVLNIDPRHSSTNASGRESDLSSNGGMGASGIGGENGILAHFRNRMKFINFEMKNRETNLAIRGPNRESVDRSVTSSVALHRAHDRIQDEKKDNILNLLDSVLRRNKEGEDDDVILGNDEEPAGVVTKDIFGYESAALNKGRTEFFYNRADHKLTKLFYLIVQPEDEEMMPMVVLKIIDSFLAKNIPKINDFFIFTSLKKVLQRTDWLLPATE